MFSVVRNTVSPVTKPVQVTESSKCGILSPTLSVVRKITFKLFFPHQAG